MYEVFLCVLLLVEFYINDNLHYIYRKVLIDIIVDFSVLKSNKEILIK